MKSPPKIGVLALQGDFDAHRKRLQGLGANVALIRNPVQLEALDALVIPGGESTTFLNLLERHGLFERLSRFVQTKPTFGTCAGAILLASEVVGHAQRSFAALDIRVRRNAYGRQIDSAIRVGSFQGTPLEMVFIRAPKIESVGQGVEVLAREGEDPVLVCQRNLLAATFHPELSIDSRVHQQFLRMVVDQPYGQRT
jgi:5'-phosphate synthase pdxT subunit